MLEWLTTGAGSLIGGLGGGNRRPSGTPGADDGAERAREERRLRDLRQVNRAVALVLGFSALVLLYTGWRAARIGPVFLWAIACLAAGGGVGFLFGIPRAGAPGAAATPPPEPRPPGAAVPATAPAAAPANGGAGLRPNTNLEEVSDWLTKIIVGLGLVHLQDLQTLVGDTARNAAAGFAAVPGPGHVSLATALIVGFAIEGFFLGYIYTRLFLQVAFARSDTDLQSSNVAAVDRLLAQARADKSGIDAGGRGAATPAQASLPSPEQQAMAEQVRRLAVASPQLPIERMEALAREYEQIRSGMAPGPARTQKMQAVVSQMTVVALGAESALERLMASPLPGDRLAAVAILKLRFQPRHTDWLAQRLVDEPPFVGFQAASALLAASRLLGGSDLEALRAAVARANQALVDKGWRNDPPRDGLIDQVLGRPAGAAAPAPAPDMAAPPAPAPAAPQAAAPPVAPPAD